MKRPKRGLKKLKQPPKTKRWCCLCEGKTKHEYNRGKLHSECIECGSFTPNKENSI